MMDKKQLLNDKAFNLSKDLTNKKIEASALESLIKKDPSGDMTDTFAKLLANKQSTIAAMETDLQKVLSKAGSKLGKVVSKLGPLGTAATVLATGDITQAIPLIGDAEAAGPSPDSLDYKIENNIPLTKEEKLQLSNPEGRKQFSEAILSDTQQGQRDKMQKERYKELNKTEGFDQNRAEENEEAFDQLKNLVTFPFISEAGASEDLSGLKKEVKKNAPEVKEISFDLTQALDDDGFTYEGVNDQGQLQVRDKYDGTVGVLQNPKDYMETWLQEKDPTSYLQYLQNKDKVSLNDKEKPIEKSPINLVERAKLNLGNVEGNIKYLKKKFGDNNVDLAAGELVVRQDGFWFKVDPEWSGTGDAFDIAKEFIGDYVIDPITTSGLQMAGGIAGGVMGGIAGSAAGATSGKALQMSLGRILDTYDASAEDTVKDLALEAVLNLGGEVSTKAVGKGMQVLGKTEIGKNIGQALSNISKSASDTVKEGLSSYLNIATGVSKPVAESMVKDGEMFDVANKMVMSKIAKNNNIDEVRSEVMGENIQEMGAVLRKYRKDVSSKLDQLENQIVESPEINKFSINLTDLRNKLMKGSEADGVQGLANNMLLGKLLKDDGMGFYSVVSAKELKDSISTQFPAEMAFKLDTIRPKLTKLVEGLNTLAKGEVKGKIGAKMAMTLKREADDFYFNTLNSSPELKQIIGPYTALLKSELSSALTNTGETGSVAKAFHSFNDFYKAQKESITIADDILRSDKPTAKLEKLISDLTDQSAGERNFATYAFMQNVGKISGLDKIQRAIVAKEAALQFNKFFPYFSGAGSKLAGAAGAVALGYGAISPMTAATVVGLTSPKITSNAVRRAARAGNALSKVPSITQERAQALSTYVMQSNNIAKALPKNEKLKVLADADLLDVVLGTNAWKPFVDQEEVK